MAVWYNNGTHTGARCVPHKSPLHTSNKTVGTTLQEALQWVFLSSLCRQRLSLMSGSKFNCITTMPQTLCSLIFLHLPCKCIALLASHFSFSVFSPLQPLFSVPLQRYPDNQGAKQLTSLTFGGNSILLDAKWNQPKLNLMLLKTSIWFCCVSLAGQRSLEK